MKTFILIPTYNEKENLATLLAELAALPAELHFLVVDDASPDGTGQIAEDLKSLYRDRLHCLHRSAPRSFAHSSLDGYRHAQSLGATKVLQMDGDLSHPIAAILPMLEMAEHCDVVIGSRYVEGGGIENWSWHRRALSAGANFYARTLLGLPFRDITAGFRCFNHRSLKLLEGQRFRCDGYGFWVELTLALWDAGCRIREYPIVFRDRSLGRSKMGWRIAREAALRVLALRRLRRKIPGEAAQALLGYRPAPEERRVIPSDQQSPQEKQG